MQSPSTPTTTDLRQVAVRLFITAIVLSPVGVGVLLDIFNIVIGRLGRTQPGTEAISTQFLDQLPVVATLWTVAIVLAVAGLAMYLKGRRQH